MPGSGTDADPWRDQMIYKTLHWYILRELFRIFLLTASALTTIMAFGGTFKPLTRGLGVGQLMVVLVNAMPAMLAYAFPMSALFAAVLVYWRLSTDNEITACRASGISYKSILLPAFILGMCVASADLVFVNFVVPMFVQRTERIVRTDLATMLVSTIKRNETFDFGGFPIIVAADDGFSTVVEPANFSAQDKARGLTSRTVVTMHGMSAIYLTKGKPAMIAVARVAYVYFDTVGTRDEVQVRVLLEDGAGYKFDTFDKVSGQLATLPPSGEAYPVPLFFKDKPKFLNYLQLSMLHDNPFAHPTVSGPMEEIRRLWTHQQIAARIVALLRARPSEPLVFRSLDGGEYRVHCAAAAADAEGNVICARNRAAPIRIDELRGGRPTAYYTCDGLRISFNEGDPTLGSTGPTRASLEMSGHLERHDQIQRVISTSNTNQSIEALLFPVAAPTGADFDAIRMDIVNNPDAYSPEVQAVVGRLRGQMAQLFQTIKSEFHSRASFALSCLALVLLGAALGIIMRGRNPLLVFVIGFVPAINIVLLITAGRRMVEDAPAGAMLGVTVVWIGNVMLLGLVAFVYSKLLRT